MSDDLFGPPDPYFNPVEPSNVTTLDSESSPASPNGRLYQRTFGDTRLSNLLALIAYLAQCGFSDVETIPAVLTHLKSAIYELLLHCVSIDRPTYAHYIQQLLRKLDILITRLIIPALKQTLERPDLVVTQLIIKEVHELVTLLYGFTNPLRIPGVLSDDQSIEGPHGLRVSSFHTTTLLSVTRKLQAALNSQIKVPGSASDFDKGIGPNNTPLNLWNDWMAQSLNMVTKLIVTILNNTVPTATVFIYFEDLMRNKGLAFLDLEYFDEFLCHFQRINAFSKTQANSALFDSQRRLIQEHFLLVIRMFPCHPLSWCTVSQAVNYLQMYIDVYNDIYEDKLLIEKIADKHESTVVKRVVDSAKFPEGHYINYINQERLSSKDVPDFVKYFDDNNEAIEVTNEKEYYIPISQPKNSESFRKVSQVNTNSNPSKEHLLSLPRSKGTEISPRTALFAANNHKRDLPEDPCYLKVYRLNEEVAQEVRELRAMVEDNIWHGNRRFKGCWKCRLFPWHKHKKCKGIMR